MEVCAPSTFLGNWVLVAPYLCSRFHIFDKPILDEYVFQVEGGPHLLSSCLSIIQDNIFLIVNDMHLFF